MERVQTEEGMGFPRTCSTCQEERLDVERVSGWTIRRMIPCDRDGCPSFSCVSDNCLEQRVVIDDFSYCSAECAERDADHRARQAD